ncbi:MAG: tetratricopeptide repeat protein [Gemmatimonadota bacterium]
MRTKLTTGIVLALLLAPATLLAQEKKKQQCNLQGTPESHLAQQMLNQANDTTKAESARQAAYKQAWGAVEGPVEDGTDDPTPYILGAQALVGMGNYAKADSLLTTFEEKAPEGCMKLARQVRFQAWANLYNQAIQAYNSQNRDQALKKFEQANAIYEDARSLVNAAALHQQRGNQSRAMELYSQALQVGGDAQQMRTAIQNLASTRLRQGDTAAAMKQYRTYLSENPDDVSVRAKYAQALAQTGNSDSAQAIFSDLVNQTGLNFDQWSQVGVGLYQAGSYKKAIEAFQKAREQRPLNKETMENLLSAYAQAEQWKKITGLADTLISWYPYDSQNYRPAVRAHDNLKNPKKAQQLLNEIQALPIQITQLGMTESGDGAYTVQGRFQTTSESAAGEEITIPFEFLNSQGDVVGSHEYTTTLPPQGESGTIQFRVQIGADAATFRYEKDPSLQGSASASGSGGGSGG